MTDDFPLTPDAARRIAALGGLDADDATAERIMRSVRGVVRAASDFRETIEFDDAPGDFARISYTGVE